LTATETQPSERLRTLLASAASEPAALAEALAVERSGLAADRRELALALDRAELDLLVRQAAGPEASPELRARVLVPDRRLRAQARRLRAAAGDLELLVRLERLLTARGVAWLERISFALLLDVRNYRDLVFQLGEYAEDGERPGLATALP
jgi:hypothetical protein